MYHCVLFTFFSHCRAVQSYKNLPKHMNWRYMSKNCKIQKRKMEKHIFASISGIRSAWKPLLISVSEDLQYTGAVGLQCHFKKVIFI